MATFMQSLAANPSGSSGIYNTQKPPDQANELAVVNQLKDREMRDFKDKAGFMADLSLKQDRMRALFDPSQQQQNQQQNQGPQVSQMRDPNAMSAAQRGDLDIKQQGLNLDQQKLAQQNRLGQEALDTKTAQEKLNQQKSDQIHAQKIAELEGKQVDFKNKLDLATQALSDKTKSGDAQLALHTEIAKNTKAYHDAEMAKQDLKFQKSQSDHQDAMKAMQQKLDAANRTHRVQKDAQGNTITTDTTKGDAAQTVNMKGKDGKTYPVPLDKVDDWKQNHSPDSAQQVNPDDGTSQDQNDDESQQ